MANFDSKQFVEDRHKAFADVLHNDSLVEMEKYCEKYGIEMPTGPNKEWIVKIGALKAILGCTDFSEEDKELSAHKVFSMGANPFFPLWLWGEDMKGEKNG